MTALEMSDEFSVVEYLQRLLSIDELHPHSVTANCYLLKLGRNIHAKISDMRQKIDAYRSVLSRFASGVTVVTAYRGERADGVTVSAFSALSLDPPLVLACVGEESDCYELLARTEHFGISVLAAQQAPLALAFAEIGDAKVQALRIFPNLWVREAVPLVANSLAHIVCRRYAVYAGGDHRIIIGEVVDLRANDAQRDPLLYFTSRFRRLDSHP